MVNDKTERETKFTLIDSLSNKIIDFYIVQSIGFGFQNSLITYESVGSDGGFTTDAGRLTQDVPVTIRLKDNLEDNLTFIKKLRDTKVPVTIFSKINNSGLFGLYLIKDVDIPITDGTGSIIATVTFREYRNAEIQTVNLTVPADKSSEAIINYMKNQNKIDKS